MLSPARPLRILIVEDEVLIALELESILQDEGHEVVGQAVTSAEAVALGETLRPDLAFVDIHLADGPTGVQVARHLAVQEHIPVLFMTANAKRVPEDYAGALGVIPKPYTERCVREVLAYVAGDPASRGGSPPAGLCLAPQSPDGAGDGDRCAIGVERAGQDSAARSAFRR